MELLNLNKQVDIYDNDYIDEKLMEAEEQMKTTTKRNSKDELLEIINNIIDEDEYKPKFSCQNNK